ncbi:hypothetical protein T484DRAFT_1755552 [Baffinella frigidus]|nr:hypothetical protein T484DRAFT_1755552 [Cryptophyta sp. CCMP2293]
MQSVGDVDHVFDITAGTGLAYEWSTDECQLSQYDTVPGYLTPESHRFVLDPSAITEQLHLMDNGFDTTADIVAMFHQSSRLMTDKNKETILDSLLSFSKKSNCGTTDIVGCLKRSIIASLKLVDTEAICLALEDDLPTDCLRRYEDELGNIYGDFTEWSKVLQSLSFDDELLGGYLFGPDSGFGKRLPTIKFVLDSLQQIGANALSLTDMLKIYLLTNTKEVNCRVAVQAIFEDRMPQTFDVATAVYVLTCCMADSRFSQSQFTVDLSWLMLNLIVDEKIQHEFEFFITTVETSLVNCKTENLKTRPGRLRLRDRVCMHQADRIRRRSDRGPPQAFCGGQRGLYEHASTACVQTTRRQYYRTFEAYKCNRVPV